MVGTRSRLIAAQLGFPLRVHSSFRGLIDTAADTRSEHSLPDLQVTTKEHIQSVNFPTRKNTHPDNTAVST